MAKDYKALADGVIFNVGGAENVASISHCVTRLRFKLKDGSKADKEALAKVPGVLKTGCNRCIRCGSGKLSSECSG